MTLKQIKEMVEQETGIADLSIISKAREHVIPRGIFCALAYKHTEETYRQIGRTIKRHYATVLYSLNSIESHLRYEPELREIYHRLDEEIRKKRLKTPTEDYRKIMQDILNNLPENKYKKAVEVLEQL